MEKSKHFYNQGIKPGFLKNEQNLICLQTNSIHEWLQRIYPSIGTYAITLVLGSHKKAIPHCEITFTNYQEQH